MGPLHFLDIITSIKFDVLQWGGLLIGVHLVQYGVERVRHLVNERWPDTTGWSEHKLREWELRNDRT